MGRRKKSGKDFSEVPDPQLKTMVAIPRERLSGWPPTIVKLAVYSPKLGNFERRFVADSDLPVDWLKDGIKDGVKHLQWEMENWLFPPPERKPTALIALEMAIEINEKIRASEKTFKKSSENLESPTSETEENSIIKVQTENSVRENQVQKPI